MIKLYIRDDGKGFDPEQTFSGHYGLGMMHERAEAAGVMLIIKSEISHGTELSIHWNNPAPMSIQKETP